MIARKTWLAGAAGLAGLALATMPAAAANWDMPTPYPDGNFHTQNIHQFVEDVAGATDGEVQITVHPAGSLVRHPEIKNAVRSGQAQIGEFLLSTLGNENPIFEVDAVPFLATSYDDARRLWDASRDTIEGLLEEQNLMLLYAVPWPPQGLYADKELNTIDDLAGLRFRAYNPATERIAQLAGAVPTQIEVPDIPQGFATGRVEAMITSASTGVESQAWDYLSHFYDTQAWLPKNAIVVNRDAFEALDAGHQEAILEAAAAAEERGWDASAAEHDKQSATLAENGVDVGPPSDELAASMREIGETLTQEWLERAGSEVESIVERYNN
jgi:TRAP-type transport system periplasmic protein